MAIDRNDAHRLHPASKEKVKHLLPSAGQVPSNVTRTGSGYTLFYSRIAQADSNSGSMVITTVVMNRRIQSIVDLGN